MLFCVFVFYWYGDHRDLHVLIHSFPTRRSSDLVESARLSRHLAAQIYGEPPANGYVYGGSGGGRRSPGCMEYGTGVYTGALPYHSGGNVEPYGTKSRVRSEQPVHFGLMFNVQRDRKSTRLNSSH